MVLTAARTGRYSVVMKLARLILIRMPSRSLIIAGLFLLLFCAGCTIHFKGKDIEFDAERQRVNHNETYNLEKIVVLRM